jgi:hypothetical protein
MDIQTTAGKQHTYDNVADKYLKVTQTKHLRNSTVGNRETVTVSVVEKKVRISDPVRR